MIYLLFRFPRKLCGSRKRDGARVQDMHFYGRSYLSSKIPEGKMCAMWCLIVYFMSSSTFNLNHTIKGCVAVERDIEIMPEPITLLSEIRREVIY